MYAKGLKGIVATETAISHIDGQAGVCLYRDKPLGELMEGFSFESVMFLLLNGEEASPKQEQLLREEMQTYRTIPARTIKLLEDTPKQVGMMSAIRTAVSSLQEEDPVQDSMKEAIRIISALPTIVAYRYRSLHDLVLIPPQSESSHIENFLTMLHGRQPTNDVVRALETYTILTMEHGLNASTFAARVTVSPRSDIFSGVTAAIGAMKGPLHGGAPSEVTSLLQEIRDARDARSVLERKIKNGERLMGFGHRLYKTVDPRAATLKGFLLNEQPDNNWLQLALHVESIAVDCLEKHKPGRGLHANVEYYAAAIMQAVEIAPMLFTPIFTMARSVGWCAHILEQQEEDVLFRPLARYIGQSAVTESP